MKMILFYDVLRESKKENHMITHITLSSAGGTLRYSEQVTGKE